jgi:hypothetical protein
MHAADEAATRLKERRRAQPATGFPASAHRNPLIPEVAMQDTTGIPLTATSEIGFYSAKDPSNFAQSGGARDDRRGRYRSLREFS